MKTGEKEICEFVSGVASRAAQGERVDSIAASQVWEELPPPRETSKRAWKEHPPWPPQKYLKMLNKLVPGVPKSILEEKNSFID